MITGRELRQNVVTVLFKYPWTAATYFLAGVLFKVFFL